MFIRDGDYFRPFMQGEGEFFNRPRQEFPHVFAPNGVVDILRADHILKTKNLHGNHIFAFITSKVIEVDTEENLAELQEQYMNCPLWQYMSKS